MDQTTYDMETAGSDDTERLMMDPEELRFIGIAASDFDANVQGDLPCGALALVFYNMRHGAGQTEALLSKGNLLNVNGMAHHPFLAFFGDPKAHTVRVRVIRNHREAANLPPSTPLMLQWPGKYRSDWFFLTAGDLAGFLTRRDEALRGPENSETGQEST